jgi:hypothetical protein
MNKKRIAIAVLLLCLVFLLAACVPGDGSYENRPAGFLSGIWHGWIAPVSLIIGLFNHNIRIYEVINTGWWYDFGFYIAVISGFGGIALTRKARHRCRKDHD